MSETSGEGVYFVSEGKYVKIGVVRAGAKRNHSWVGREAEFFEAVARRMRNLQTGNPRPLRLLNAHPYLSEGEVHLRFRRFHKHGEWFDRRVVPHIEELCRDAV